MAAEVTYQKDPDSELDYQIDWSDWLGTDTITASTWTVPTGLTEGTGGQASTKTTTTTTIWLSGGTLGTAYEVVNHITTAAGRQDDRTLGFVLADK